MCSVKRDGSSLRPTGDDSSAQAWLQFDDREAVPLRRGVTVVGRAERCDLVLDDPLVSRRHACFVVESNCATIKDLGSANGVLVNGVRIEESQALVEGDRVALGRREVRFGFRAPSIQRSGRRRAEEIETVRRETEPLRESLSAAQGTLTAPPEAPAEEPADMTRKANIFEMLSGVAEKALSLGRGAEAERILSRPLLNLLDEGRRSKRAMSRAEADMACALAVKLAQVTGKAEWIDYIFRLDTLLVCPPSAQVIDELYAVVRAIPEIDVNLFRSYLDVVRSAQVRLDPSDRFLVRRLEGLRGVLSSI